MGAARGEYRKRAQTGRGAVVNVYVDPEVKEAAFAVAHSKGWTLSFWVQETMKRAILDETVKIISPEQMRVVTSHA